MRAWDCRPWGTENILAEAPDPGRMFRWLYGSTGQVRPALASGRTLYVCSSKHVLSPSPVICSCCHTSWQSPPSRADWLSVGSMAGTSNFWASSSRVWSPEGKSEWSRPLTRLRYRLRQSGLTAVVSKFPSCWASRLGEDADLERDDLELEELEDTRASSEARGLSLEARVPAVEGMTWAVGIGIWLRMGWKEGLLLVLQMSRTKQEWEINETKY